MTEESANNQEVKDRATDVAATTSDAVVDWEKKYNEEVKSSKSYRSRAQKAEGKLEKHDVESEAARKLKMEEDGKLKELVSEMEQQIETLKVKADAGDAMVKDRHEKLLLELPEDDRADFEDLPTNQLEKVVAKLKASEAVKPEIPSVKAAVKPAPEQTKNIWDMPRDERNANFDDAKATYQQQHKKI
jgi:hypothetical protein